MASCSEFTWALTFENPWKLLTLGGPASFALLAQDPHDTEAMALLRQTLQNDFFCRDLRHVNPEKGIQNGGGSEMEEVEDAEGGGAERDVVEAVLAPFKDMMLCCVTLKDAR